MHVVNHLLLVCSIARWHSLVTCVREFEREKDKVHIFLLTFLILHCMKSRKLCTSFVLFKYSMEVLLSVRMWNKVALFVENDYETTGLEPQ